MKKIFIAGSFLLFSPGTQDEKYNSPIVTYVYKTFRGMDYVVIAEAGGNYHAGGVCTINLTKDSLECAKLKK